MRPETEPRLKERPITAEEHNFDDVDDGPIGKGRRAPSQRRCLVTRTHDEPQHMVRFVIGPEGQIVADLAARLPGRGMWLRAERAVLEDPQLPRFFARAARQKVDVPASLIESVRDGLAKRLLDGISLGRRAGESVCGFQKCRERIVAGRVGVVICAAGASQDEVARLLSGHRELPVVWVPGHVLAASFGRERAVYAVMSPGALAERVKAEYKRFAGVAECTPPGPEIGQ
ncbi:DUF448 domain-containing protein [Bombella sp. ESL0378]|uniref:DUF448 domain-containing protein n=1 Tax=unclassified Bombella TaxID=2644098 RepID=UPI0012D8920C|nr:MULTISPECIES: DUF448 domain-containing protein [unclassified Bombella]MUG04226.1 DUF448 domain-containing protein [Bombella sp. ESL0378]MUG89720.1 DUF448 domain-containing protein [Bombella sp. ESL0385]